MLHNLSFSLAVIVILHFTLSLTTQKATPFNLALVPLSLKAMAFVISSLTLTNASFHILNSSSFGSRYPTVGLWWAEKVFLTVDHIQVTLEKQPHMNNSHMNEKCSWKAWDNKRAVMDWRTVVIAISKFRLETGVSDAMEKGVRNGCC